MAKRGTLEHPKTKRLARALDLPSWAALGLLEAFWHWVGRYCPTGHLSEEDVLDCSDTIRYDADLGKVLVLAGWLDKTESGFYVHDWHDHADDTVKKTLQKRKESFANGAKVRKQTDSRTDPEPFANDSRQARAMSHEPGAMSLEPSENGTVIDGETPLQRLASLCWSNFQSVQAFSNGVTKAQKDGIAKVCAEYGHLEPARLLEESEKCADWYRAKPRYGGKGVTESTPAGNAFRSWLAKLKPEQTRTKPERDELLPIGEVEVIGKCPG